MQVIYDLNQWRALRAQFPVDKRVGLITTMGNLHAGHQSLCEKSLAETDVTIVSLFVNPTQFNDPQDFKNYPRTQTADLALLEQTGAHYCLIPEKEALYPDDFRYKISETQEALRLEGGARPGHFDGVLTVVMKLFQLVKPHVTYFGEKDYQQCQLLQGMIQAFFLDIQFVICPTLREPNDLAYSSRNNRLSPEEKELAIYFAQCFRQAKSLDQIQEELEKKGIEVDYLEAQGDRRFAAVKIGQVRLIDTRLDPTIKPRGVGDEVQGVEDALSCVL